MKPEIDRFDRTPRWCGIFGFLRRALPGVQHATKVNAPPKSQHPLIYFARISIREISQMCHLGQSTVRGLIASNSIPHIRIGRKILIPRQRFLNWWDSDALSLRIPSLKR